MVAAAHPGESGRYNTRQEDKVIRRYLRAARKAKALLILDIQPGRSDFFTETVRLRKWLKEPDVGLAIDPEWRMGPGEVPGQRDRLGRGARGQRHHGVAGKARRGRNLPEKLFLIHQFTDDMVDDTELQARAGSGDGAQRRRLRRPGNKIAKYHDFTKSPRDFFHRASSSSTARTRT